MILTNFNLLFINDKKTSEFVQGVFYHLSVNEKRLKKHRIKLK